MEKDIGQILNKYNQEIKRHIGVLKEDFDAKVKLIAEQYDSIIKRLDSHDGKFASIEERLGSHGVRLGSIENKLDSHGVRIASIEEKLTSIEKNIEIMKVDIAFIKSGLKKKVDVEEFGALENRVAILEARMGKTGV